jgi:pentatricopeptide repeat protein
VNERETLAFPKVYCLSFSYDLIFFVPIVNIDDNLSPHIVWVFQKSDDLRLRTYAPIYQTYLDQGDVSSALKLFVKMRESENVTLQTETYIQLIACIAENGYFR